MTVRRFLVQLASKLPAVGAIGLLWMIGTRWFEERPIRDFCASPLVGLSRTEAGERARAAGLHVAPGTKEDQVPGPKEGIGLVWCLIGHEREQVTSVRFIRE